METCVEIGQKALDTFPLDGVETDAAGFAPGCVFGDVQMVAKVPKAHRIGGGLWAGLIQKTDGDVLFGKTLCLQFLVGCLQ